MFGHTSLLEAYGTAIDSYKRVLNTFDYKDKIIEKILTEFELKDCAAFIGSYLFFDPKKETELEKYYKDENGDPSTDARTYKKTIQDFTSKLKKTFKKNNYVRFCMGSILHANDVSHHLSILLKKEGDRVLIKLFNPGFFYLPSRYGDLTDQLVHEAIRSIGLYPVSFHQSMSTFLGSAYNPQDYCRGGLFGQIRSLVHYKYGIHNESYCQTWCILMMLYELNVLKLDVSYDFTKTYINNWPTDQKKLEIAIRQFILWIVYQFEHDIPFHEEFTKELNEIGCVYINENFGETLMQAFKTLHKEITLPDTWKVLG